MLLVLSPGVGLCSNKILFIKATVKPVGAWGHSYPGLDYLSGYFFIKCSIIFMHLKAFTANLEKGIAHLRLLAQVEGKHRLRNDTLILQLVKHGDGSREGYVGVIQAKDAIINSAFKPVFRHT